MYEYSIAIFRHSLRSLARLVRKGAAYAAEQHIPPEVLLDTRLAPDMFTLAQQVRGVSYHACAAAANLTGEVPPEYDGEPGTFAELLAEIEETLEWLDALPAGRLAGAESREITLELRRGPVRFNGQRYLAHFALPNFFFHLTTAYDILRHCGVAVGKTDFLGDFKGLTR
jgi:uncharacterized protein